LATSNEDGKIYIGPSLKPCVPPVRAPMMDARVCIHATHVAGGRGHPKGHARTCPLAVRAPPWPFVPHMRALRVCPLCRARLSHPFAPLPCAPPVYKTHKLVVHSTTWASGPLTTERWLTAGCLGGDHSFYIHSHSHAQGCACMYVTFHVFLFMFIVNVCQLGGHIKLLASLYTF
jgi:hypothetical protein